MYQNSTEQHNQSSDKTSLANGFTSTVGIKQEKEISFELQLLQQQEQHWHRHRQQQEQASQHRSCQDDGNTAHEDFSID